MGGEVVWHTAAVQYELLYGILYGIWHPQTQGLGTYFIGVQILVSPSTKPS
jgi:hypothetical protein